VPVAGFVVRSGSNGGSGEAGDGFVRAWISSRASALAASAEKVLGRPLLMGTKRVCKQSVRR
jgi:hypothetical protein